MPPSGSSSPVLLAMRVGAAFHAELSARYPVIGPPERSLEALVAALPEAERARIRAIVTMGTVGASHAAIEALPALGLVCNLGSGYENVDVAHANARGVAVTHSPAANAAAVADLAIGLMIASIRRMSAGSDYLRSGAWEKSGRMRTGGRGLTGRRVGVYGLGAIGEKVARRAAAFEMVIGYHNRNPRPDVPWAYHPSLAALAEWADVLVIAARADASNRHAVDAGVLAALGPEGHVVNIARGSVIDETALIEALREGRLGGAGLDVFETEPIVPEALRTLPNVALTPHLGGDTREAQAAMGMMVLANLEAFFAGRPVPNPVPGSAVLPAGARAAS